MIKQLIVVVCVLALSAISPVVSDKPQFKPDAATKVTWKFKEKPRSGTDVSVIFLDWEPSLMIENPGRFTKQDFGVEIKSGDGAFTAVEKDPRMKRGKYSYNINIVPCEDQQIRFFAKNEDGTSYFIHPDIIQASNNADIASSSFKLSSPQGGKVEETEGLLTVTWSPSKCASSYLVVFQSSGDPVEKEVADTRLELNMKDLTETCGQYEVSVTAVMEEKWSDTHYISTVSTAPDMSAVDQLEVETSPTQNSVVARWYGYKSMPCVSKYSVALCGEDGEDCEESVSVTLDDSLAYLEFSSKPSLTECSPYTLVIKPEYELQELKEKRVSFLTKSPGLADVSSLMSPVSAVMSSDQHVLVTWRGVKCATEYHVYQQVVSSPPATDWDLVTTTTATTTTVQGVPCTEYIYGVRAVTDGEESEIVKAEEPIMISLNDAEPYSAPGLSLSPTTSSLELTWDHARCVQSYRLRVCPAGDTEHCLEQMMSPKSPSGSHMTGVVEDLSPCTAYDLQIFANTADKEIREAAVFTFKTEAPASIAPEDFTVLEDPVSKKVQLNFSPQSCVTEYAVYEMADQEQSMLIKKTDTNSATIDLPQPCTEYRFAVSALVGETEGPKTEFIGEKVPPRNGKESTPSLHIYQKYNNTVELQLVSPDFNQKCEVESYELKYRSLGEDTESEVTIPSTDLVEGNIIIIDDFPQTVDNGMMIEGRIKYAGYDWSPWISSQSKVPDIVVEEGNGIIVPIVIGAMVALVIILAIIFFMVRRKKVSQNKYNCDNGDTSESKKLNGEGDV